jgi:hypothetical protein
VRDGDEHLGGVAALPDLAVDPQLHRQRLGVGHLVLGYDPGTDRAEGVDGLGEGEHTGLHLPALDVTGGDVVEDRVPGDVVLGFVGAEELADLADDDGQLELVVELLGQALGVDDGVVGSDDRVDVLEEHDPLVHRVRPADGLQLLVMVGEVAGRVEELLGHDRRPQPDVGQREALPRLGDLAAPLEPLPRRGAAELDDDLVLQATDPADVEGDQLHDDDSLSFYESRFR